MITKKSKIFTIPYRVVKYWKKKNSSNNREQNENQQSCSLS